MYYLINVCYVDDGSYVIFEGGQNNMFNCIDICICDLGFILGILWVESFNDLLCLLYQWFYQVYENWILNFNSLV